jgi:fatty acid desaturase
LWCAALIAFMLTLFVGCGALNVWLWLHSDLPAAAKLALSLPLFALAGQGIHLMGYIGHEGMHFTLAKSRHVSMCLGTVFSSMTVLFVQMGMTLDHWTHHRYCNTERDPDLQLFGRFRSFPARLFLARSAANRHYMRRAYRMMVGKPLDPSIASIVFPMRHATMRLYCLFNFACAAAWGAVYLAIGVMDVRVLLIGWLLPMLFTNAISGLRPYVEHMGLPGEDWQNSRSRTSPLWTLLDFGGNYHLEHHLYPNVPQWLLPKLHRHLREQGAFDDDMPFEAGAITAYGRTFGEYPLPDGVVIAQR